MEWLFTFPVPARGIFLAQLLQFAVSGFFVWLAVCPYLIIVLWSAGYRAWALPLAALATLYVNLLLASLRVLGETWLRKTFSHARLKNIQAVCTVLGSLAFMGTMALALMPTMPQFFIDLARRLPLGVLWFPPSAPILLCLPGGAAAAAALGLAIMAALAPALSVLAAERLVRPGLVTETAVYQGRRGAATRRADTPRSFQGILGKELRLLLRDRSFMAQTLIVPLLAIGLQVLINPAIFRAVSGDFRHAATMAFVIGAYVLMSSGFSVLAVEGKALWLLYTFPQSIDRIMRRKALLWAVVSSVYAVAVLGIAWGRAAAVGPEALADAALAVAGVFIYAFIAAGIGVLGTDPLEQEIQRRFRPTMVYLYMLLAGLYAAGLYAPSAWDKAALVVLSALLAYAIWQKVRDRAPYLLDATQAPPPQIALSDGLIAALVFFVVQGLVLILLTMDDGAPPAVAAIIAYLAAGLVVSHLSLLVFWRRKVPDLLATLGLRPPAERATSLGTAAVYGLLGGAAAALCGLLYLAAINHIEPLRQMKDELPTLMNLAEGPARVCLAALLIVAAPVFEEFIFRGILFRGLRRSARLGVAVTGSAAIFAIVHPPISVIPVFVLGLVTALVFERTKLLAAPILAHMVYNTVVLFAIW
jgi:hypothetical protein